MDGTFPERCFKAEAKYRVLEVENAKCVSFCLIISVRVGQPRCRADAAPIKAKRSLLLPAVRTGDVFDIYARMIAAHMGKTYSRQS